MLLLNRWSCPLTAVAARYTPDRRANFDIFLPLWLARNNKLIFGTLFVCGLAYAGWLWYQRTGVYGGARKSRPFFTRAATPCRA